ncbi:unnamed protein product [Cylindrotheca closterium]|uniref:Uncharacterized protein n=1 Tax=Cylindrotheca closterium TaxID=2856 RepID=A0AAD2FDT7_9STRA|nr:unnamed protein product [Cylindrotheca closterium]
MNRFLSSILLLLSITSSVSASRHSFTRSVTKASLFGVRGGGLFGGKDDKNEAEVEQGEKKMYPAMSQEEIEDWMEHIPVFAVTDANGAGVILKPDEDTSVFYFFFNPLAANATLTQLQKVNEGMELKVSAFSLGKIWFKLLNADPNQEVLLKAPDSDDKKTATGIQYRLVPDTKDLLGARMLLTMSPEDSEALKTGETMTQEMAQKAIEKAMTESPKFKETYNEIPVFTIAQMRMQKQAAEGETGEPVTLLPMYFSLQNMVGTWQQFMSSAAPDMQGVEPAINLMSLHDLVAMMKKDSEIDFRNVVLVPAAPEGEGQSAAAGRPAGPANAMAGMGGATLGDI